MKNKDINMLEEAYASMYNEEASKKKKPDGDGDGVPDWADKKHGQDDHEDEKVEEDFDRMGLIDNDEYSADNRDISTTELTILPEGEITITVYPWQLVQDAIENLGLSPEKENEVLKLLKSSYDLANSSFDA